MNPSSFDGFHYGLAILAGCLLILWVRERVKASQFQATLSDMQQALQKFQHETRQLEYRIERFDVLWFPNVVLSDASKEVLNVLPGTPHCKKCLIPLAASNGDGWSCPQCRATFPESLADLQVLDTVGRTALEYFKERHKRYRLPAKK